MQLGPRYFTALLYVLLTFWTPLALADDPVEPKFPDERAAEAETRITAFEARFKPDDLLQIKDDDKDALEKADADLEKLLEELNAELGDPPGTEPPAEGSAATPTEEGAGTKPQHVGRLNAEQTTKTRALRDRVVSARTELRVRIATAKPAVAAETTTAETPPVAEPAKLPFDEVKEGLESTDPLNRLEAARQALAKLSEDDIKKLETNANDDIRAAFAAARLEKSTLDSFQANFSRTTTGAAGSADNVDKIAVNSAIPSLISGTREQITQAAQEVAASLMPDERKAFLEKTPNLPETARTALVAAFGTQNALDKKLNDQEIRVNKPENREAVGAYSRLSNKMSTTTPLDESGAKVASEQAERLFLASKPSQFKGLTEDFVAKRDATNTGRGAAQLTLTKLRERNDGLVGDEQAILGFRRSILVDKVEGTRAFDAALATTERIPALMAMSQNDLQTQVDKILGADHSLAGNRALVALHTARRATADEVLTQETALRKRRTEDNLTPSGMTMEELAYGSVFSAADERAKEKLRSDVYSRAMSLETAIKSEINFDRYALELAQKHEKTLGGIERSLAIATTNADSLRGLQVVNTRAARERADVVSALGFIAQRSELRGEESRREDVVAFAAAYVQQNGTAGLKAELERRKLSLGDEEIFTTATQGVRAVQGASPFQGALATERTRVQSWSEFQRSFNYNPQTGQLTVLDQRLFDKMQQVYGADVLRYHAIQTGSEKLLAGSFATAKKMEDGSTQWAGIDMSKELRLGLQRSPLFQGDVAFRFQAPAATPSSARPGTSQVSGGAEEAEIKMSSATIVVNPAGGGLSVAMAALRDQPDIPRSSITLLPAGQKMPDSVEINMRGTGRAQPVVQTASVGVPRRETASARPGTQQVDGNGIGFNPERVMDSLRVQSQVCDMSDPNSPCAQAPRRRPIGVRRPKPTGRRVR